MAFDTPSVIVCSLKLLLLLLLLNIEEHASSRVKKNKGTEYDALEKQDTETEWL